MEHFVIQTFGPVLGNDGATFRLWAPLVDRVAVKIGDQAPLRMNRSADGWHTLEQKGVGVGQRYAFVMPDGLIVPDPASRYQPDDVHGPSELVDLDHYQWTVPQWKGRAWHEMVISEIHIGTFTPQGTFAAAIERLDHLSQLGITAIQIMPISDFPGRFGWGYDGVLPYAPESTYGRPEDLMALIDAAHQRGISVFLDVVYNHFGPDGNYQPIYAPLFTHKHKTPWGDGVNYDDEGGRLVRDFIIENALYWLETFRFDGLRLDAVHAIRDDSPEHLLLELARRAREAAGDRHVHLMLENENNDPALLERRKDLEPLHYTSQWNDDLHHVLHVAATGERFAYYADYRGSPHDIGRALAEGLVFQGEHMPYRGDRRGSPSVHLPPTAFISFIQNHDQIGNRAAGDRIMALQEIPVIKAIAAVYLLAPEIPMLFMGEEWNARQPFPYFCDFDEELNEKVRVGRRQELSRLPGFDAEDLVDPTAEETFLSTKLDWLVSPEQEEMLSYYRDLLSLRHRAIVPRLNSIEGHSGSFDADAAATTVHWRMGDGSVLNLCANLSHSAVELVTTIDGEPLFAVGRIAGNRLEPWTVIWTLSG
jgi:1,4-alpha-glucan branching enzyme/maltooligosyltrehalose trehalohydrolase